MRDLFIITVFSLLPFSMFSQDITLPSTITEVTVYEQGATIHREINLPAFSGVSYVIFDSLPHDLSKPTIQVNVDDHLEIISVTNKQLTYKEIEQKELLPFYELNSKVRDSIHYIQKLNQALSDEKKLILKHDDFSGEDGDNVAKVKDAAALYETRLKEIYLLELKYQRVIRSLNNEITANNIEINKLSAIGKYYTQIKAKVRNPQNRKGKISLSYYVNQASWYSFYDARISSENSKLQHKAYITQTTGEEWKDVKISLSNKSPIRRNKAPSLIPKWQSVKEVKGKSNDEYSEGILIDANSGEPILFATVVIAGTRNAVESNLDGFFKIYNPQRRPLEFSYVGYNPLKAEASNDQFMRVSLSEGNLADEIVVTQYKVPLIEFNNTSTGSIVTSDDIRSLPTKSINSIAASSAGMRVHDSNGDISIRGGRGSGQVYYVDGARVSGADLVPQKDNYARQAVTSKAQRSFNQVTIELEDPYTIPSDGQPYDVMVANHTIDYLRKYYVAPAMEQLAYCKVGVDNWQMYDLFSGKANIFVDGFFGGVTQLNMGGNSDTLWLDIGPDEGIDVSRVELKDYNKKTFLKRKIVEEKRFKVVITNHKDVAVQVTIAEALPVSQNGDLEVEINELSNGVMNEDTGIVEWDMVLAPRQTIEVMVDYQLKYKKDYVLN